MIERVEFLDFADDTRSGLQITIFYEDEYKDVFTVYEPSHIQVLYSSMDSDPDPLVLMSNIRTTCRMTLH